MESEYDIREIQLNEIEILKYIHGVCQENGLTYYMFGGTLLGAVRHKGFIPWDDDIDIVMPREDYDKLIEISKEWKGRYYLAVPEKDKNYYLQYGKVYDTYTQLENSGNDHNFNMAGVFVDIFPLDGLGNDYQKAIRHKERIMFWRKREYYLYKRRYGYKKEKWVNEIVEIPFRLLGKSFLYSVLSKLVHKYNFYDSNYVGNIVGGNKTACIKKSIFSSSLEMEFESEKFNGIVQYDELLRIIYGDYMTLPPEEKRVSLHTMSYKSAAQRNGKYN